jgi:hypothetical protein
VNVGDLARIAKSHRAMSASRPWRIPVTIAGLFWHPVSDGTIGCFRDRERPAELAREWIDRIQGTGHVPRWREAKEDSRPSQLCALSHAAPVRACLSPIIKDVSGPDRQPSPDALVVAAKINEAVEVLGDPDRRRLHDANGASECQGGSRGQDDAVLAVLGSRGITISGRALS